MEGEARVADAILIINVGSSSLKFATFTHQVEPGLILRGKLDASPGEIHLSAQDADGSVLEDRKVSLKDGVGLETTLPLLLDWMNRRFADRLIAVGHRVVHGGMHFTNPTRITPDVIEGLEALVPLDPLHQPHHLAAMRVLAHAMPDVPQVACFDTAFHAGQPRLAKLFALPSRYAASGIIRYGFHGISYEYIASRLREIDPVAASGRTVVAHLGNGSSMCAVKNGRSVASTMGLTPLDGLPMGTRCGTLDPGVILYLMRAEHRDAASIEHLLYQESGLLGVSGTSSDVRRFSQAMILAAKKRLIYWPIARVVNWVLWQRQCPGSMRWSSPAVLARTRQRCAKGYVVPASGLASVWTPPQITQDRHESAHPTARCRHG